MNPAEERLIRRPVQISCSTADLGADQARGGCCVMIPACGGNEMHANSLQTRSPLAFQSFYVVGPVLFFTPVFVCES